MELTIKEEPIKVNIDNKEVHIQSGTTLLELSKKYKDFYKGPIILAFVDGHLRELRYKIEESCHITFLDTTDKDGYRVYTRSLKFVLIKAIRDVLGTEEPIKVIIHYAINSGYFCELKGNIELTKELIDKFKVRMDEIIAADLPFVKTTEKLEKANKIFISQNMLDKVNLIKYRKASNINLYCLDGLYDYFYGYMTYSTGILKYYELYQYDKGIIIQLMSRNEPYVIPDFDLDKKLFKTLYKTSKWAEIMDVENVGALNDIISKGGINELILVSEALMEKRIGKIADKIIEDIDQKKFVFIAGPSSSGKTTFAHRLSIQLRAHGIKPHTISVDNYFKSREDTPKDEEGNYNFECLEALDLDLLNKDLTDLLAGKTVDIPEFNFISGKKEYKGNHLTLEKNGILVIEGIHCLNDALSYAIPKKNKFKIYISALTQLNLDDHNRIPTTDARLIRRMVRDSQYRGASAQKTISMWPSVRHGEEMYIFPFQEQADVMFNSALIYELAVLKQYAEPLLFSVPRDSIEYIEAKRLIKFLDYFLGVSSERIPTNSLLREFVGGSCFR